MNKNSQSNNDASSESQKARPQRSRLPLMVIVFLILAACVLGALELNNKLISKTLTSMFGPPKVTLQESFQENSDGPTFDHSAFDALLKQYVDTDGFVDYANLKTGQDKLDSYIKTIGVAKIDDLGRNERLAFLINAYNAFTLRLILDNYPLETIKDIPDAKRWDAVRWNLAGETVSLNQIEHEYVRANFKEPRIHFALVCAAIGCPPLRNESYSGKQLERQLTGQVTYVHQHGTWFKYDKGSKSLQLTQLYNWYGDDFVQVAGSVEKFAATYSPELKADLDQGVKPSITWLDYDWTLNDKLKRIAR